MYLERDKGWLLMLMKMVMTCPVYRGQSCQCLCGYNTYAQLMFGSASLGNIARGVVQVGRQAGGQPSRATVAK